MSFKDVSLTDGYKTLRTPGGALRPSELSTVYFFFKMCLLCFLNKFSFFPKRKEKKECVPGHIVRHGRARVQDYEKQTLLLSSSSDYKGQAILDSQKAGALIL